MESYKRGSHTVWDCKCHIVWVTKYRYAVLGGDVGHRCRELQWQCDGRGLGCVHQGSAATGTGRRLPGDLSPPYGGPIRLSAVTRSHRLSGGGEFTILKMSDFFDCAVFPKTLTQARAVFLNQI